MTQNKKIIDVKKTFRDYLKEYYHLFADNPIIKLIIVILVFIFLWNHYGIGFFFGFVVGLLYTIYFLYAFKSILKTLVKLYDRIDIKKDE